MPDKDRIYLDYAATTPLRKEVLAAMTPHLGECFGNPSSLHREGKAANEALEIARHSLLRSLGADGFRLAFCGGGTEADNTAILGVVFAHLRAGKAASDLHLVASAVEHSAVHGALEQAALLGVPHSLVPVDDFGRVDPTDVLRSLRPETILVSVMAVNNEVGTMEPLTAIASELSERGLPLHCDAIQMLGKSPLHDLIEEVDLLTLSAHKVYGPPGIAALLVRPTLVFRGFVRGGRQEGHLRGGTQAVAQAVGFSRAVSLVVEEMGVEVPRLCALRDRLRAGIEERLDGFRFNTPRESSSPNILNVSFGSVEGESLLRDLDQAGVAVSTGSACNVGASLPSRVLQAMGRSAEEVRGSIRFSFGCSSTPDSVDQALNCLELAVRRLRSIAPASR